MAAERPPRQPLSRAELIEAVRTLMTGGLGSEEANDELIGRVERSVPDPEVSDLMFFSDPPLTPEEVVEAALAYRPIVL